MDAQIPASVMRLGVSDVLVDHATSDQSKATLGLTPPQMAERILATFPIETPMLSRETVA
jgi:1-deoxy-D-xylulose-5-phosphate synthase